MSILARLAHDTSGGPATEYAFLMALIAAIVGFGMVTLGDSLGRFYDQSGTGFQTDFAFPGQRNSMVLGAMGAVDPVEPAEADSGGEPRCVEVGSNCIAGRD